MTPCSVLIAGDRAMPRLPIAPHLRAVDRRLCTPLPGFECPLFSRINGRFPQFDGHVPVEDALAELVAGEA